MTPTDPTDEMAHATSVAIGTAGVLIAGPSGSGKSSLALALMSLGARLVSDDYTILRRTDDTIWMRAPPAILGRIEVRGVGILAAEVCQSAPLRLVIDLGKAETERLPPMRQTGLGGIDLPCLHKCDGPHFHMAIWQYMKAGRIA